MSETAVYQTKRLGLLASFKTGKLDSNAAVTNGLFPFFTCSQQTFSTNTFSFDDECVILAGNNANGIYPLKYYSGKFDAYQRTYVIRTLNKSILNTKYLYYALRPKLEELRSISTGAATKFLTLTLLNGIEIGVPPVSVQEKVTSILGAYDDLIEANRKRVALLEDMARGLFEEWFVRFRFPGHEAVAMVDTPDGPLPDGWRWACFGDLVHETRDSVMPDQLDATTPYLGLEHLPRRQTTMDEFGRSDQVGSLKLHFQRGDILFGKIRPYFHKVIWAPCEGIASSDAIIYRPTAPGNEALALAVASSDDFVAMSVQTSNGTKMPRANPTVLRGYPVAVDAGAIVQRYQDSAMPMIAQCALLMAANRRIASSRDLLLPRLISGQLSVVEAERELEKAA